MQAENSPPTNCMRSKQLVGVKSELPETIAYSLLDADTSRHQWLPSMIDSSCKKKSRRPKTHLPALIQCKQCGGDFKPRNYKSQFCGLECANAAHSDRMSGKGNSRFKDGKSRALWFDLMRQPVLDRDNYKCVACLDAERIRFYVAKGVPCFRSSLVIHHIDSDSGNNRIKNLVTLCQNCHIVHHKSHQTPFPWLGEYASQASESMTSRLMAVITSLETKHLCTIAS